MEIYSIILTFDLMCEKKNLKNKKKRNYWGRCPKKNYWGRCPKREEKEKRKRDGKEVKKG